MWVDRRIIAHRIDRCFESASEEAGPVLGQIKMISARQVQHIVLLIGVDNVVVFVIDLIPYLWPSDQLMVFVELILVGDERLTVNGVFVEIFPVLAHVGYLLPEPGAIFLLLDLADRHLSLAAVLVGDCLIVLVPDGLLK